MKRRNPYPGLSRATSRHGKVSWRFRMKGKPPGYIHNLTYGSKDFEAAYERLLSGDSLGPSKYSKAVYGSFDWLIERYKRTPDWQDIGPVYKKNLSNQLERFRIEHGSKLVSHLHRKHVEGLMMRKHDTPASANELLKLIKRLCRFAIRQELILCDPTVGIKKFKTNPDGYHTWTDAEIIQFEDYHGLESKAVLALRLLLYTGATREDLAVMGWQNIKNGRIEYRRIKTKQTVDLTIHSQLLEVLEYVSRDQLLFMTTEYHKAFASSAAFGNWFSRACKNAGVPGRSHGLRKAGATRLAEAGGTELEIMALLGHSTTNEALTYVRKARRSKLGDAAIEKMENVSNQIARLDKYNHNVLKNKGK